MSTAAMKQELGRVYAPDIASLPEPPEEFEFRATDVDNDVLRRLKHRQVVIRTRTSAVSAPNRYRVDAETYKIAQEYAEHRPGFDCCGGSGIRNVAGTLRCKDCDAEISEAEFREVVR